MGINKYVICILTTFKLLGLFYGMSPVKSTAKIMFKTKRVRKQFKDTPKILKLIVRDFDVVAGLFEKDIVLTRVKDSVKGGSGVHKANRAVDVRNEHLGKKIFSDVQAYALVDFINTLYPRTDGMKTVVYHSFNGNPFHFHFQIPFFRSVL